MTDMTEATHQAQDAGQQKNESVGSVLQAARLAKGLTIEDVSAALRIRHTQLRAIEENNIDALPGITYAVGFVRSYANYLGLSGADLVQKFKVEHGYGPAPSKLDFPEPVAESRMPDPLIIGVGAFCALVVLALWTFYSNMDAPVADELAQAQTVPVVALEETDISADAVAGPAAMTTEGENVVVDVTGTTGVATEAAVSGEAAVAIDTSIAGVDPVAAVAEVVEAPPAPVVAPPSPPAPVVVPKKEPAIQVRPQVKSRVTLKATQASWVQITDSKGDVIYKKVLRPGEQYAVPDQKGLSLVTANAGGLEIVVDGDRVQKIGQPGEIVRGVDLDPDTLKIKRQRTPR